MKGKATIGFVNHGVVVGLTMMNTAGYGSVMGIMLAGHGLQDLILSGGAIVDSEERAEMDTFLVPLVISRIGPFRSRLFRVFEKGPRDEIPKNNKPVDSEYPPRSITTELY